MTDQPEVEDAELVEAEEVSTPQEKEEVRAVALRSAPIQQMKEQAEDIENLLNNLMKPDEHYGKFFEGQDKPALLQPGAEKLCSAFGMTPRYDVEITNFEIEGLPWGHREVNVTCSLHTRGDQIFLGQGVGSCTTLEPKYRYRQAEDTTDVEVPKEFWDSGDSNAERDFDILRKALENANADYPTNANLGTEKEEGTWFITYKSGRSENPDPAAEWNTVKKMAKKRALVDAVKTVTAASDIFTQDVEDMDESQFNGGAPRPQNRKPQRGQQQRRRQPQGEQNARSKYDQGLRNVKARLEQATENGDDMTEVISGALAFIKKWPPQEWKRAAAVIREYVPADAKIKIPDQPPSTQ